MTENNELHVYLDHRVVDRAIKVWLQEDDKTIWVMVDDFKLSYHGDWHGARAAMKKTAEMLENL